MTDEPHPNAPPPETPPAKAESPAEKQRLRMEALLTAVDQRSEMLRTLLEDTGITFERFIEVIRRALIRNPDILLADAGSVIEACINAATDGLVPDGRQGAIVIYNVNLKKRRSDPDSWGKRANWQPMYQGLLEIAYASGNFRSIECRVVYEGDTFEYDLGDEPFIKHRPKGRAAGTKQPPIVGAYAVAKTVNGGVFREVFEGADIEKVNKVSKASNGPGASWPEEMARKGPLRRMWKFLPKNDAMNRIVERDNEGFDLSALEAPETGPVREKRLSAGFAEPAQLTQGADPVMPGQTVQREEELVGAGGAPASNEEAKSNVAPMEVAPEDSDEDTDTRAPEVDLLQTTLKVATSWLNIKQGLRTFSKSPTGQEEIGDRVARQRGWEKFKELREAGADKTDFISDPLLFECWLIGEDPEPDHDTIEGNWAIVQADKAFGKLPQEDQDRILLRVAEALGAADGARSG